MTNLTMTIMVKNKIADYFDRHGRYPDVLIVTENTLKTLLAEATGVVRRQKQFTIPDQGALESIFGLRVVVVKDFQLLQSISV